MEALRARDIHMSLFVRIWMDSDESGFGFGFGLRFGFGFGSEFLK